MLLTSATAATEDTRTADNTQPARVLTAPWSDRGESTDRIGSDRPSKLVRWLRKLQRGTSLLTALDRLESPLGGRTGRPIDKHSLQHLHRLIFFAKLALREGEIDAQRLDILIVRKGALP